MPVTPTPGGHASVLALHRYPVKSMLGERLAELALDGRGVTADRSWSVRTRQGKIGSGKNTRRFAAVPALQQVRARVTTSGGVVVTLPDGSVYPVESKELAERQRRLVGQPVKLATESVVSHFDDGPVSLIARASVEAISEYRGEHVDDDRFRPNIVLAAVGPFLDEVWIGRRLRIGGATLHVEQASPRCVMIDQPTADLPAQPGNLLAVGRLNGARLGIVARVEQPGIVRLGDRVVVE